MAFDIGDVLKGESLLPAAAIGVGIYLLAPLLRPLAKTAITAASSPTTGLPTPSTR